MYAKYYYDDSDNDNDELAGDDSSETCQEPKPKKIKVVDETAFKFKVHQILQQVNDIGPGTFAICGKLTDVPTTAIAVKNYPTRIKFPLYEDEIASILSAFENSQYGKRTETILDRTFRNSWELNPNGFEILNSEWDVYINEKLIPRISKEMGIVAPFKAMLYKLLMYKSGSFFKPHRDSEKVSRMFATLVILLPSKYSGGQLVISHDSITKTIDFSTAAGPSNEFSYFFSAFYCDCVHEVLPVEGVRICFIYNLVLTDHTPVVLAPRTSIVGNMLVNLFKDWGEKSGPKKIVYALSHQYTEENLSFENLKSADRSIVSFLKHWSTQNSMILMLGFLLKETRFENGYESFDSNDSEYFENIEKTYKISNLQALSNAESMGYKIKSMSVSFEQEAIPEDCFNKKPLSKTVEETGNEGVNVSLFYRNAAVVLFPKDNIMQILVENHDNKAYETLFLKEYKNFLSSNREEEAEAKLLKWASDITSCDRHEPSHGIKHVDSLFSAFIDFNRLNLLQRFLDCYSTLTVKRIPLIVSQCEKYGWNSFSTQLEKMFGQLSDHKCAIDMLNLLVVESGSINTEKKKVLKMLCQKIVDMWIKKASQSYWEYSFSTRAKTQAQKTKENREDTKNFFIFCKIAKQISFEIVKLSKTQSLSVVVPVLLKLAAQNKNTLDKCWTETAKYFLKKMELALISSWRREDFESCGCGDCVLTQTYMKSQKISKSFRIETYRRWHLQQRLKRMEHIHHEIKRSVNQQTLVVTKTKKSDKLRTTVLAKKLLPKLKAVMRQ